jgi:hypothetical protein
MPRSIKTFLLWLLLAALPVQGIAAAAMMSCRSGHESLEVSEPAVAHHHHDMAVPAHDAVAHNDGAHHSHHAHHGHDKHGATTSCSSCAACCVGAAAIPSGLAWTFVHNKSEPVIVSPSPFMTGHIPVGLERPPRALSA